MASQWFAVKTFYRTVAEGRPVKPDKYFDPDLTLLEERLLLIKAKSKVEALKKAEKDAREYAKTINYVNPYGQCVKMDYMNLIDIFEVGKGINDKSEIFIANRMISKKVPSKKIEHIYIEKKLTRKIPGGESSWIKSI